ncbi:MAG: acetyl-CoA hydrolase/transferase family protein [Lachnospirales bacterium]
MYKSKVISTDDALSKIPKNCNIVFGLAPAEPRTIASRLHEIYDRIEKVSVTTCLPIADAPYYTEEKFSDRFFMNGWFYTTPMRKSQKHGNISMIPNHLHLAEKKRVQAMPTNLYIGNCTRPDKHGFVSLSLSNVYERKSLEKAELVILEINDNLPRTFGDMEVHVNDIDFFVETDYAIPEIPNIEPGEKDVKIGNYIADLINDGDCIQLGIGAIPNAVAKALESKKDLGVHTEMLTSGIAKLARLGVVTGKNKNMHRNKIVCAFAYGDKDLYDFLDNNPSVLVMDGNYVNDPYVVGLNDNQISINSTIEIDLTGQCCSESIGHVQFSGTGGQADTAIGAQRSKGGKSFIALHSTAMVKNKETGEREEVSKIVPMLKEGAVVSLSRNDVDFVVTEYGVAALRGTTVAERVHLLIEVAHPKFRSELRETAINLGYIGG